MRTLRICTSTVPPEQIFERRLFPVFVVGLARSGTSMMTGVCERLGVNMIYNTETEEMIEKRDKSEQARYGDGYRMNPDGFFEVGGCQIFTTLLEILQTPYRGCKLVAWPPQGVNPMILSMLAFSGVARVVMMWREPEAIRKSQQACYRTKEPPPPIEEADEVFARQEGLLATTLATTHAQLVRAGAQVLNVRYETMVTDPEKGVLAVARFINAPHDPVDAIRWVDTGKNRFSDVKS